MFSLNRLAVISFAGAALIPTLAASTPTARLSPAPSSATEAPASPQLTGTLAVATVNTADIGTVAPAVTPAVDDQSVECIAKVVRHEAANQSERGQLAVAQLIVARTQEGSRFGRTPCAVVNQPGQFFDTDAYHPDRSSDAWNRAVSVSRDALAHASPDVAPGALFYHAAYQAPPRFFRSRQRVMTLGDHIFYR